MHQVHSVEVQHLELFQAYAQQLRCYGFSELLNRRAKFDLRPLWLQWNPVASLRQGSVLITLEYVIKREALAVLLVLPRELDPDEPLVGQPQLLQHAASLLAEDSVAHLYPLLPLKFQIAKLVMRRVHDHAVQQFLGTRLGLLELILKLLIVQYRFHFIERAELLILLAGVVFQFFVVNGDERSGGPLDISLELLKQALGLLVHVLGILHVGTEALQIGQLPRGVLQLNHELLQRLDQAR